MKKDYFAPASLGKVLLIGLATAGTLTGCTTGNQMTRSDWGKCLGAIALGTGAGALVNGEKGAYVGAAAGIAACFVINAQSRRTRSAAQVESDYRSVHHAVRCCRGVCRGRALPDQPPRQQRTAW